MLSDRRTASAAQGQAAGWSDVGSWSALHEALPGARDKLAKRDVFIEHSDGCYLDAESRLVPVVGLQDYVVVETKDAVLMTPSGRVQDMKLIVERLKAVGRHEYELHRVEYRPWGSYDNIDNWRRSQVKRLTIKRGAQPSLQLHQHCAARRIVVSGTARITCGEKLFLLEKNQPT